MRGCDTVKREGVSPSDVFLPYDGYAYNSMLEWDSYKDWFDRTADGLHIHYKTIGEIHDSIYGEYMGNATVLYTREEYGDEILSNRNE